MEDSIEFDLKDLLSKIKKRWKLIVGILILSIIATLGYYTLTNEPIYESKIKVIIVKKDSNTDLSNQDIINYSNLISTYKILALTEPVFELAAEKYPSLETDQFKENTFVDILEGSMVLDIYEHNKSAKDAYYGLDAFYSAFVELSEGYLNDWELKKIEDASIADSPLKNSVSQKVIAVSVVSLMFSVTLSLLLEYKKKK